MPPNNQQPINGQQSMPPQAVNPQGMPMPPVGGIPTQELPTEQGGQKTPKEATKKANTSSTQNSLLISEIREGMVIMNDGSFRAIITCESINFDLMSSREREGVEYSYQNFLNALYFPIQIFIRSQRVDIGPYLDKLVAIRRGQDNMLLNVLMDDYIDFVDVLSQDANIMDKSFYIVVPYFPAGELDLQNVKGQAKGFFGKIFAQPQTTATKIDSVTYQKAKDEIKNRVDSVSNGLFQIGVQCQQLNTRDLGRLYYNVYNPDTAVREPLANFQDITSTFVRKGNGEAARPYVNGGGQNG